MVAVREMGAMLSEGLAETFHLFTFFGQQTISSGREPSEETSHGLGIDSALGVGLTIAHLVPVQVIFSELHVEKATVQRKPVQAEFASAEDEAARAYPPWAFRCVGTVLARYDCPERAEGDRRRGVRD